METKQSSWFNSKQLPVKQEKDTRAWDSFNRVHSSHVLSTFWNNITFLIDWVSSDILCGKHKSLESIMISWVFNSSWSYLYQLKGRQATKHEQYRIQSDVMYHCSQPENFEVVVVVMLLLNPSMSWPISLWAIPARCGAAALQLEGECSCCCSNGGPWHRRWLQGWNAVKQLEAYRQSCCRGFYRNSHAGDLCWRYFTPKMWNIMQAIYERRNVSKLCNLGLKQEWLIFL